MKDKIKIGHGHRKICKVCQRNHTEPCSHCVWLPGMKRPSWFLLVEGEKIPKDAGDLIQ